MEDRLRRGLGADLGGSPRRGAPARGEPARHSDRRGDRRRDRPVRARDRPRARPARRRAFPLDEIASGARRRLGDAAVPLAARLPVLREPVCDAIVARFAKRNAMIAAAVFIPGVDLPILTLNELRLVTEDRARPRRGARRQPRPPSCAASVGAGFGFRAIARELLDAIPVAGWAVKAGVAYGGTRAIGEAAVRYFDVRTECSPPRRARSTRSGRSARTRRRRDGSRAAHTAPAGSGSERARPVPSSRAAPRSRPAWSGRRRGCGADSRRVSSSSRAGCGTRPHPAPVPSSGRLRRSWTARDERRAGDRQHGPAEEDRIGRARRRDAEGLASRGRGRAEPPPSAASLTIVPELESATTADVP